MHEGGGKKPSPQAEGDGSTQAVGGTGKVGVRADAGADKT